MQFIMNIPSHCIVTENFLLTFFLSLSFYPLVVTDTSAVDRITHKHMEMTREISVWCQLLSFLFCSSCVWRTSGHSSRCATTSLAFATASCLTPLTCLMSGTSARWVQCFHALLFPRAGTTFIICWWKGCVLNIRVFGGRNVLYRTDKTSLALGTVCWSAYVGSGLYVEVEDSLSDLRCLSEDVIHIHMCLLNEFSHHSAIYVRCEPNLYISIRLLEFLNSLNSVYLSQQVQHNMTGIWEKTLD